MSSVSDDDKAKFPDLAELNRSVTSTIVRAEALPPGSWEAQRAFREVADLEEEIARAYPSDKIKSPVHLSIGQEAVSVGVCSALVSESGSQAEDFAVKVAAEYEAIRVERILKERLSGVAIPARLPGRKLPLLFNHDKPGKGSASGPNGEEDGRDFHGILE
ncbi:MAG: hypothetical protein HC793_01155 [Aquincola sp.]|nr:hypothetical protein [Aquincola sp.]